MKTWSKQEILDTMDITLLDVRAGPSDYDAFFKEVIVLSPPACVVQPLFVAEAASRLKGSGTAVCSVIGFPGGNSVTEVKAFEAARAVRDGAGELDMVVNHAALRRLDRTAVVEDIAAVVKAAGKARVKVIIDSCVLSLEEKRLACEAIVQGGANFLKTNSGYLGSARPDAADIRMFRQLLPDRIVIKASGWVTDFDRWREWYEAGARRFGVLVSQVYEILKGAEAAR